MVTKKQTRFIYGGFLLAIAVVLFVLSGSNKITGTYGVNKTIGWAWNLANLLPYAAYGFILTAFLCTYLAMYAFGIRPNKWLMAVNGLSFLAVLPIYAIVLGSNTLLYIVAGCLLVAFLSFFANIIVSLIKYSKAGRNVAYQK